MRDWYATHAGDRLHAVLGDRSMCGICSVAWHRHAPVPVCARCGAMYGVAFPAPPGERHTSADAPFFERYAEARRSDAD